MADRVFDFGEIPAADGEERKTGYVLFDAETHSASEECPYLILADPEAALAHHAYGAFLNPVRGSAFSAAENGVMKAYDIQRLDSRFEALITWLGENHVSVRLTGSRDAQSFRVYRIRAMAPDGKSIHKEKDSFLQLTIARLLEADPPKAVPEEEEETVPDRLMLTDLNTMLNFLNCAGITMPANIRRWADRQVQIIRSNTVSPEERRHAQRALSMMLNIQWKGDYFEPIDPVRARAILDEELYGLERVKQRIIETIIQINRTHTLPAYGILLAGPAGIGKSQIAYAVARILRLPWTSLDMSAIHDSEALTGSPRVYANAKAGRIMEAFTESGASNIVFIINELDKADQNTVNGNPADALLTLLDNLGYTDNYIECMIPTSGVYPVATANDKSRISAPLMSRFAVIDIPDYTLEEKKTIFRKFSLPRVLKRMGMEPGECTVTAEAEDVIIRTLEGQTGCRDLEQAAEHLAANALYRIETTGVREVIFDAEMTAALLENEN